MDASAKEFHFNKKVDGKEVPVSEVFGKYLDRILESIKTEGGK